MYWHLDKNINFNSRSACGIHKNMARQYEEQKIHLTLKNKDVGVSCEDALHKTPKMTQTYCR